MAQVSNNYYLVSSFMFYHINRIIDFAHISAWFKGLGSIIIWRSSSVFVLWGAKKVHDLVLNHGMKSPSLHFFLSLDYIESSKIYDSPQSHCLEYSWHTHTLKNTGTSSWTCLMTSLAKVIIHIGPYTSCTIDNINF